ncbi:MAG: hypothetical protein JKY29_14145 [Gammaproteobacteria bacterium]|nr:hypothetical protein [Gammaproteobacteria bacterium]
MIRNIIKPITATLVLLAFSQSALADHGKNFHCSGFPIRSEQAKEAMSGLAHNNTMRNIVLAYVYQWENEEIKRTCEAAANGETVDFGCLDGRRNWDAIQSRIPEELAGKSNQDLRPLMLQLQEQGFNAGARNKVLDYCEGLGVIDRKVKG